MPRAMLPLWRCKSTSFLSSEVNMSACVPRDTCSQVLLFTSGDLLRWRAPKILWNFVRFNFLSYYIWRVNESSMPEMCILSIFILLIHSDFWSDVSI